MNNCYLKKLFGLVSRQAERQLKQDPTILVRFGVKTTVTSLYTYLLEREVIINQPAGREDQFHNLVLMAMQKEHYRREDLFL